MGAVFVVVAEIAFEFAFEAGLLGDEVAGERELPAIFEDRALNPFDAAAGLLAAGVG